MSCPNDFSLMENKPQNLIPYLTFFKKSTRDILITASPIAPFNWGMGGRHLSVLA